MIAIMRSMFRKSYQKKRAGLASSSSLFWSNMDQFKDDTIPYLGGVFDFPSS
jgi:hypothetical protein